MSETDLSFWDEEFYPMILVGRDPDALPLEKIEGDSEIVTDIDADSEIF